MEGTKAGETLARLFQLDRLRHEINNINSAFDLVYDTHLTIALAGKTE